MATCDENLDNVSLPHDDRVEVNIHQNETPDSSTLNRSSNRLLANDKKILDYIKNIALTNISEGLSGCVQLTSPGCLSLDMKYISENLCLSLAQLDGLIKLEDICNVCLTDPAEGDTIIYNPATDCWINEGGTGSSVAEGVMREKCRFFPITDYDCGELLKAPSINSGRQVIEDTFDVTKFNNSWNIDPNDILGFYVVVRNFGRFDSSSASGVSWKTQAQYPDNQYHTINSHEAWNTDDDGGTAQTVFVPYDHSTSTDGFFKMRSDTQNIMSQHYLDEDGVPMNFYKIIGAKICQINSPIFPNFSTTHIKGMVAPGTIEVDGFIDENTASDPVYKNWSSDSPSTLSNTFSGIVPVIAPKNSITTELEFVGLLTQSASDDDPGTGTGSGGNSIVRGYITYDWLDRSVRGHITYNAGGSPQTQGTGVFNGRLNEDVSINSLDHSGLVIKSTTFAQLRKIIKLPVISDATGKIMSRNVAYTLRHYNISAKERGAGRSDITEIPAENTTFNLTSENCGETIVINNTENRTVLLPSSASGCRFTFAKVNSGNVTIQAVDADVISDSGPGGSIVNDDENETWATLTLESVKEGVWVIISGHGTWITS